jgi:hypothetical protein
VSAEEVDRVASALLKTNQQQGIHPALHEVRLSAEIHEEKENIVKALKNSGGWDDGINPLKQRMAELLASSFKLGIPQHRLPESLVAGDRLLVDLNHACNDPLKSCSGHNSERK